MILLTFSIITILLIIVFSLALRESDEEFEIEDWNKSRRLKKFTSAFFIFS